METSGRERRHRYFTAANFCRLVDQEELDKDSSGYSDLDLKNVGGFLPVMPQLFYSAEEELINYSDTFKDADRRPKKPKKKKVLKNPILPNGKVKRGRPKKVVNDGVEPSVSTKPRKNKRKREDEGETSLEIPENPKETSTVTTVAEQTDGTMTSHFSDEYASWRVNQELSSSEDVDDHARSRRKVQEQSMKKQCQKPKQSKIYRLNRL